MKYPIQYFLVTLFHFFSIIAFSQNRKASNIFFRTIGDKIEIFYDLPSNKDTLEIKIYFHKKSDPKTRYRLKWASGSIGIGRFSGKKKKVTWSFKKEPGYLFTGSGFYFEISVKKYSAVLPE